MTLQAKFNLSILPPDREAQVYIIYISHLAVFSVSLCKITHQHHPSVMVCKVYTEPNRETTPDEVLHLRPAPQSEIAMLFPRSPPGGAPAHSGLGNCTEAFSMVSILNYSCIEMKHSLS